MKKITMQIVITFMLCTHLVGRVTSTDDICDLIGLLTCSVKKCGSETRGPGQHSGPAATGGKASAEGEVDF